MWFYDSPIGLIKIKLNQSGKYSLFIQNELIGSYSAPQKAADAIYYFQTEYDKWDALDGRVFDVPESISDWQKSN